MSLVAQPTILWFLVLRPLGHSVHVVHYHIINFFRSFQKLGPLRSYATIQGAWCIKTTFLSSPLHWTERLWVQTPRPAKIFRLNFQFLRWMFFPDPLTFLSHFFLIQLARWYLQSSFFLLVFKQVVDTYKNSFRLSYLSILSKCSQSPIWEIPVWACFLGLKNPSILYSQLLQLAQTLLCLDLLCFELGSN